MAVFKSAGSTPSERLLTKLCENTFLGFWSYANTFRDQGGPKELCDLLVVCGDRIILFSDKSCAFPNTGDLKLDWSRWFRRSILEAARQIHGAERWLKEHPDRVFLDRTCTLPLPISLNDVATCKFHRVVVALGAQERCRAHLGGRGSLFLAPTISGKAHFDMRHQDVAPFFIGTIEHTPGHFHVLDDFTLPLLLKELDTITDFVTYLDFKEKLFDCNKVGRIAGEENLLALFLTGCVNDGRWSALLGTAQDGAALEIQNGGWDLATGSAWYEERRKVLKGSYTWDRIIQEFATHAFGGTLIEGSVPTIAANEQLFRCMAREPRMSRAFLAAKMLDRWSQSGHDRADYRIVASPTFDDTLYVFVFVPNIHDSPESYREARQDHLRQYAVLVHCRNKKFRRVVGIASDAGNEPYRTFEVLLLEGDRWTSEMEVLATQIERELRVTGCATIHRITDPAPLPLVNRGPKLIRPPRADGRIGRNDPCPCRSGKKFKHCCLRRQKDQN